MKSFLPKIIISLFLILLSYYLFFLKPQQALYQAHKTLSSHHTNLIQNRLAIIQLIQLQTTNPYSTQEQSLLLNQLKTSNQQGLENLTNQTSLTNLPKNLKQAITQLQTKHQTLLQNQQTLLNQLQQTNHPQTIFTSPPAITLLTTQTNLILEYDRQIKIINQQLEKLSL